MRIFAALVLMLPAWAVAETLPPCAGGWAVYDDFTRIEAVSEGRWAVNDAAGSFRQGDDGLRFQAMAGDPPARLISSRRFGHVQVRMAFRDYVSTNHTGAGQGQGSYAALGMGRSGDYVRVMRGDVRNGPYFEANHVVGGVPAVWHQTAAVGQGRLAIHAGHDGVRLFASAALEGDESWDAIGPVLQPDWSGPVPMMVMGSAGQSGATGFTILAVMSRRCDP